MSKKRPTKKHTPRISKEDRLQAVLRHPQFKQDWQYIQNLKAEAHTENDLQKLDYEIKELDRKWGGPIMTSFYASHCNNLDLLHRTFKELHHSVHVVNKFESPPSSKYSPRKGMLDALKDLFNPEKTRYLTLELDLQESKDKLMKEVERLIDLYRRPPKGRVGKTTCDPWKIYTMHHYKKKSLLKIAKEIYGFKDNPTYNEKAKAKYKQVTRAYKKACKMIQDVTPIT